MRREWLKVDWSIFRNVHKRNAHCFRRPCVVHNPTQHHMCTWPPHWRDDRGILERICEHGIGHPDPDQFEYWKQTDQEWQAIHGCDLCCRPNDAMSVEDCRG